MSHEIEDNRMFSTKLTPWHGLGVVLAEPPTSAEAIKAAGMDWQVEARKLWWETNKPGVAGAIAGALGKLAAVPVPGRKALVRDFDEKFLGVVSNDYVPLQNVEAFSFFDPLVQDGTAVYETAGVLFGGRKVWIQARVNRGMVIAGDELRNYLLLFMGHDGKTSISVQPTPQRVVCNNTLQMSLAYGEIFTFAHRGGVLEKLTNTRDRLLGVLSQFDVIRAELEKLAARAMTAEEGLCYVREVLEFPVLSAEEQTGEANVTPETVPASVDGAVADNRQDEEENPDRDEKIDRAESNRKAALARILDLHETGLGASPATRDTLWGWYNAVIEFVDYFAGGRAKDRGNYLVLGDGARLKLRAMEVAQDWAVR